jgi:PAS domain S-box-containing protein
MALHKHLGRQLRRLSLDDIIPPSAAAWQQLLTSISSAYDAWDRERGMVEDSFNLATAEMDTLTGKLAEERDKFASIFRSAAVGMVIADAEGRVLEVNPALQKMLGRPMDELVGRRAEDLVDKVDADVCLSTIRDLSLSHVVSHGGRWRLVHQNGEHVVVDAQTTAVLDGQGRTKMIISIVEDVTEKNRLEIELRHSQKLESVGRLAAGIAHEINTPIQFVGDNVSFLSGSFAQLLALCDMYRELCAKAALAPLSETDLARQKQQEEEADLDYIRSAVPKSIASTIDGVGRVARIVQSMKAFAHPDRGERSPADINTALQNTLTVATNELKYVAKVETALGDIPSIPCYLSDLNQVFLNLLVNAAHAIGDAVGQSGQRGTITVRTYVEKGSLVVAISDTGTGIPPAVQSRIFEPFFTTKAVGKGTGQGLALARSVVVEQHGGSITFETAMGKGTTFFIRLPLVVPV